MASSMKDTFGKKLYVPPSKKSTDALPSPESLRGMVVIKGKRPPDDDDAEEEEENEEVDPYDEAIKGAKDKNAKPPKILPELAKLTLLHGTKYKNFEGSIKQPESHMHSISESKITKILVKRKENALLWQQYNVEHVRIYSRSIAQYWPNSVANPFLDCESLFWKDDAHLSGWC
jgi:phosphatidylinositol phospholipase C delta